MQPGLGQTAQMLEGKKNDQGISEALEDYANRVKGKNVLDSQKQSPPRKASHVKAPSMSLKSLGGIKFPSNRRH